MKSSRLTTWYNTNKRSLPWRETTDPYKIWVSEIILQQTRVKQGIDYYVNFMRSFPDLTSLANAEEQDVLLLWQGLGYYSRARNMHYAARQIIKEHQGIFPTDYKSLLKIKGIGKYTAAAIASICYNESVPAIDGNAYRVYARYYGLKTNIHSSQAYATFLKIGLHAIAGENPGIFNQAIMELGALICLPQNPSCESCPIYYNCYASTHKKQKELPIKIKSKKINNRTLHYFVIRKKEKILIKKRNEKDIWKNLYELPCIEKENLSIEDVKENLGNHIAHINLIYSTYHILTHQKIHMYFWETHVINNSKIAVHDNYTWVHFHELDKFPYPKPIYDFIQKFLLG